jgi:RNA recognition motif-containing protein
MVSETSPLPRHEPADTITSILVKNMPQDIKACELYDSFRPYGIIRKVCFPRNKNPNSPSYGKFQGFAFVTYETVSQADGAFKALSTSGLSIRGMKLKMRRAYRAALEEAPSPISPLYAEPITHVDVTNSAAPVSAEPLSSATIVSETSPSLPCEPANTAKNVIAKNVSPFITYSMLYERFCHYGNVLDVCLPKTDGEPRNVVIKYSTSRSAAHAVRCLHGLQLDGKKVTVELERETETTIRSEKPVEKPAEKPAEKSTKDRKETTLCATPVSVESSVPRDFTPAMTSIIVKNLPRNITLSELYEYFGRYGILYDVYLPWNKDSHSPSYGTPDGNAFIAYESASEADRAFQAFSTRGRSMYGNQATVTKSYRETRF